jgi:hypothetical protein
VIYFTQAANLWKWPEHSLVQGPCPYLVADGIEFLVRGAARRNGPSAREVTTLAALIAKPEIFTSFIGKPGNMGAVPQEDQKLPSRERQSADKQAGGPSLPRLGAVAG